MFGKILSLVILLTCLLHEFYFLFKLKVKRDLGPELRS